MPHPPSRPLRSVHRPSASLAPQFAGFIAEDIGPDDLEDMYTKGHAAIRENPAAQLTAKEDKYPSHKRGKMSLSQKRDRIRQKIASYKKKTAAADDDDDEDE